MTTRTRKLYCVKHGNTSVLDWMLESCFTSKRKAMTKARSLAKSEGTVFVYSESVKDPRDRQMLWSKKTGRFAGLKDRETLPEAVRRLATRAGKGHLAEDVIDAMSGGMPPTASRELRALVSRVIAGLRREGRM